MTLIEPNAANFHAGLESVTPAGPRKIVDKAEGCANFHVLRVVIDSREARQTHRVGKGACLGIMVGRSVDVDLRFVEYVCVENVLERNEVICRVIEDMLQVEEWANGLVGVNDVALGAAVQRGFIAKLVINTR